MNHLFQKLQLVVFLLLFTQNYVYAIAANQPYDFSGFTDEGNNLEHNDFVLSGTSRGTTMNMSLGGSIAYGAEASGGACVYKLSVDGINTGSFELSDISISEYDASSKIIDISILGNRLLGGTPVKSTNTLGENDDVVDSYDGSDFGLTSFNGVLLSSFEIHFRDNIDSSCGNLDFNSFTIANAQAPAPADTTPPTLSNISHENVTGSAVDLKATSNEAGKIYYSLSDRSSSPTVEQVIGHQVERLYSDGNNIVQADTSTTFNISNLLDPSTTYYYYVMAEDASGNKSGIERRSFTTPSAIDADATLTTASLVSEPVPLASTIDTEGEARDLFDFKITDGGGGDGLSTDVSQVVLHTDGTADFSKVTWRLRGDGASNVVGVYSAGDNTLTFSGLSISVPDNTNKSYTVLGYYNTPTGLTNNQTYKLSIDGDDDLTVSASGTQMSGSNSAVNNGAGTQVDITATKLIFETLPSNFSFD